MTDWTMKRYNDELEEIYSMYGKKVDFMLEVTIMDCYKGEDFLTPIYEDKFSDNDFCLCFDHKIELIEIFLDMRNDFRRYVEEINKMREKGFEIIKDFEFSLHGCAISSFINRYRHRILNFLNGE